MIRFECDRCGVRLQANDAARFIVKIEAYASVGPMVWDEKDEPQDPKREMQRVIDQLRQANPDDVEDRTYRAMRFDLCGSCHREYLRDPIGRSTHPVSNLNSRQP